MQHLTLLDTIGNTPTVILKTYSTESATILAKLEGGNPGGSIKDRVALALLRSGIEQDLITKDTNIIEATSGNTGIGLAMLCAHFGYTFTAVMPESASVERRKILALYGATIVLTDGDKGTNHAIEVVKQKVADDPMYVTLDQFSNVANVDAHYQGTGFEIMRDVPSITHCVAGMGTGGTLMGLQKRLREHTHYVSIVGVEPGKGSSIQGLRNMEDYVPPIFEKTKLDVTLRIQDDDQAYMLAREIFLREGISVGISSGAALWGALEIQKTCPKGSVIVVIFPDRGDRYVSTKLFL